MLHISVSKSVHICTFATVTVHICTVTVDLVSNILYFFLSPLPHSHLSLALSQSLSLSLLLSDPSLQSQILFFNMIFRLAKMMPPEQILRLQCSKTQWNRWSNTLRPLRWSNILRHRSHPLRRLPPRPWQNRRAHHPNYRPHGLLHPRFPQLQTQRLL